MQGDAGRAGAVPDLLDRHAPNQKLAVGHGLDGATGRFKDVDQLVGRRCTHRDAGLLQVGQQAGGDQPSMVQDDDLVGEVLDLGQQVAGHEHRAAGCRPCTKQVAEITDALRVQSVAWLVEHEDGRIAQQGCGEAQPLPHT